MKIVFIDDDDGLINAWKRIFKDYPEVLVERCLYMDQAVAIIGEHHPDVIFLDHNLHDGGVGLEIARQFRAQANPPTIYSTSSYAEKGELHDQYAAIGIEWIGKNPQDLIAKVKKLLKKK